MPPSGMSPMCWLPGRAQPGGSSTVPILSKPPQQLWGCGQMFFGVTGLVPTQGVGLGPGAVNFGWKPALCACRTVTGVGGVHVSLCACGCVSLCPCVLASPQPLPVPTATGGSAGWTTSQPSTGRARGRPQPPLWTTRRSAPRRSCCTSTSGAAAAAAGRTQVSPTAPSSIWHCPTAPTAGPGTGALLSPSARAYLYFAQGMG